MEDSAAKALGPVTGLFSVILVISVLTGYATLFSIMFPSWTDKRIAAINHQSRACFWRGCLTAILLLVLMALLGHYGKQHPPLSAVAGLLALSLFILLSVGVVPSILVVGRKVPVGLVLPDTVLWHSLFGSLILFLAVLFPVVGWALVFYWICVGIGSVVGPF